MKRTGAAHRDLDELLCGPDTPRAAVVVAGLLFGAVSFFVTGYMPARNQAWAVPALPSYVQAAIIGALWIAAGASRAIDVVRKPRALTVAFVCGVTHEQRRRVAAAWIVRRSKEPALFGLCAGLSMHAGKALLLGAPAPLEAAVLGVAVAMMPGGGYALAAALRGGLVHPGARDTKRFIPLTLGGERWRIARTRANLRVSRLAGRVARGMTAVYLRRLLLYIGRCEPVMFAAVNLVLPAVAALLLIVIASPLAVFPVIGMLGLAAAALGRNIELFGTAARRSAAAPYYPAAPHAVFAAHCLLAALQSVPYGIGFLLALLSVEPAGAGAALASFSLGLITLCLLAASVYCRAGEDIAAAASAYGSCVFLILAGAAITVWGWALFGVVAAFVFWPRRGGYSLISFNSRSTRSLDETPSASA